MEHPLDEAAVWQRVTGSAGSEDSPAATCLPELRGIYAQMETATGVLGRMARTGLRGVSGIFQAQQQQTKTLGALCYLLSGAAESPAPAKAPSGPLAQQLSWLLKETEQTANRLAAIAPRTGGLIHESIQALSVAQQQLWNRLLGLLAGTL